MKNKSRVSEFTNIEEAEAWANDTFRGFGRMFSSGRNPTDWTDANQSVIEALNGIRQINPEYLNDVQLVFVHPSDHAKAGMEEAAGLYNKSNRTAFVIANPGARHNAVHEIGHYFYESNKHFRDNWQDLYLASLKDEPIPEIYKISRSDVDALQLINEWFADNLGWADKLRSESSLVTRHWDFINTET